MFLFRKSNLIKLLFSLFLILGVSFCFSGLVKAEEESENQETTQATDTPEVIKEEIPEKEPGEEEEKEETPPPEEETEQPKNLRILYQGGLSDSEGIPVADGKYNMQFKIYDAQIEGSILWQEEYTFYNAISLKDGQFKIILGRKNTLSLNLDDAPFWFGVTIGQVSEEGGIEWEEEMEPRKKITTLSELLGVEGLTPEQWENLSQLIREKLGENADVVLLFDLSQLENLEPGEETGFPSNIYEFFQKIVNFLSEKITEIGEKINQILAKLEGVVNTLAEIKSKIDTLYDVLVVQPGLVPVEVKPLPPEDLPLDYTEKITGKAVIQEGENLVKIFNKSIEEESLIFVSFLEDPGSFWWISEKTAGQSFTITLKEPAPQDLNLDYWILNKKSEELPPEEPQPEEPPIEEPPPEEVPPEEVPPEEPPTEETPPEEPQPEETEEEQPEEVPPEEVSPEESQPQEETTKEQQGEET